MVNVRYLRKMIDGVPVLTTPAEIDVTTAEQLRAVLLAATEQYRTLVMDMTRTRFCDVAAAHALIAARKHVLAKGGELRLVVPADGTVQRVLTLLGVDFSIPCFARLEEAVAAAFDGAHRRSVLSGSHADQHQVKS